MKADVEAVMDQACVELDAQNARVAELKIVISSWKNGWSRVRRRYMLLSLNIRFCTMRLKR